MNLDDLLGKAYEADQLKHDRSGAVKLIRDAIKDDPELAAALKARQVDLQRVRAARRYGNQDGCYVTGTLCDILQAFAASP